MRRQHTNLLPYSRSLCYRALPSLLPLTMNTATCEATCYTYTSSPFCLLLTSGHMIFKPPVRIPTMRHTQVRRRGRRDFRSQLGDQAVCDAQGAHSDGRAVALTTRRSPMQSFCSSSSSRPIRSLTHLLSPHIPPTTLSSPSPPLVSHSRVLLACPPAKGAQHHSRVQADRMARRLSERRTLAV